MAAALTLLGGTAAAAMAAPVYTTLYTFKSSADGYDPNSALIGTGGILYGTTAFGGPGNACAEDACGTVFALKPSTEGQPWTKTIMFKFYPPQTYGEYPNGVILEGTRLYGATQYYEDSELNPHYSDAFDLAASPTGQKATIISTFGGAAIVPPVSAVGNLVGRSASILYGVSSSGGSSHWGQVFSLTLVSGKWQAATIYSFATSVQPQGNLILDSAGNLYGVTSGGGDSKNCASGCGTVYELVAPNKSQGTWTQKVLFNFTGAPLATGGKNNGENDGQNPMSGLAMDSSGNLYGTTTYGGTGGVGTVFELVRPKLSGGLWTYDLVYTFLGQGNGAYPVGGLTVGSKGVLYGTTVGGAPDDGTVFQLTPPATAGNPWSQTVLHRFVTATEGSPQATLLLRGDILYGTTANVGNQNQYVAGNTVFSLVP